MNQLMISIYAWFFDQIKIFTYIHVRGKDYGKFQDLECCYVQNSLHCLNRFVWIYKLVVYITDNLKQHWVWYIHHICVPILTSIHLIDLGYTRTDSVYQNQEIPIQKIHNLIKNLMRYVLSKWVNDIIEHYIDVSGRAHDKFLHQEYYYMKNNQSFEHLFPQIHKLKLKLSAIWSNWDNS